MTSFYSLLKGRKMSFLSTKIFYFREKEVGLENKETIVDAFKVHYLPMKDYFMIFFSLCVQLQMEN